MRSLIAGVVLVVAAGGLTAQEKKDKKPALAGVITLDGKPLPGGKVSFHLPDQKVKPVKADIKDGKYEVEKLPAGEYVVAIECEVEKDDGKGGKAKVNIIPAKYGDPKTSALKITVKDATSTFDFDLKSK